MSDHYKIAVLGDQDSVLGFKALGLDVFPAETVEEGRETLHRLAPGELCHRLPDRAAGPGARPPRLPVTRTT